jgi:heme exporter protein A
MRLIVENLACTRSGHTLFQGLNFVLAEGEGLRIVGPNGAGKTSLLRLIAGLLAPTHGRVALEGAEGVIGEAAHLVAHQEAVKGALTVRENLEFWRAVLGATGGVGLAAVEAALSALGLSALAQFPARVLSAGQRRRLALARLLVAKRRLWLLDEPASGLDADGQQTLSRMIAEHVSAGGIAVMATHGAPEISAAREIRLGGGA